MRVQLAQQREAVAREQSQTTTALGANSHINAKLMDLTRDLDAARADAAAAAAAHAAAYARSEDAVLRAAEAEGVVEALRARIALRGESFA
jgi:hypothetical protein